jgi:2-keto-3-deoxy-galactonokinase
MMRDERNAEERVGSAMCSIRTPMLQSRLGRAKKKASLKVVVQGAEGATATRTTAAAAATVVVQLLLLQYCCCCYCCCCSLLT